MIHKFSKSYANMWTFKENLTADNENLVKHNDRLYQIYKEQPERKFCKICHGTEKRWQFHSHGVTYFCCDTCGHINGSHEDTEEYCRMLYENDDGCFGNTYEDSEKARYLQRVETIYLPKVKFMKEVLTNSMVGGGYKLLRSEIFGYWRGNRSFCLRDA